MGYLSAVDMANTDSTLEQQITWHLRANCYPPVPLVMLGACIEAIGIVQAAQWGDCDLYEPVPLPDGVKWRDCDEAPAVEIVKGYRLEAWIQGEGE
jgi:hypothetical protein